MNYNWQYYYNKEVYETPFQKPKKFNALLLMNFHLFHEYKELNFP